MPGFVVNSLGGSGTANISPGISGRRQFYYNYFWDIQELFGKTTQNDDCLIALREAGTPTITINKEHYVASSLEYKYAKSVVWEDVRVLWYDSEGLFKHIIDWRDTVWTPECGIKQAVEYKKRSQIGSFLPTGLRPNTWQLINSWPSQIKHGDLTYTSSDVKIVEVTITYDWAREIAG